MSKPYNKKYCRDYALDYAERSRHHVYKRTGEEFFDWLGSAIRQAIRDRVDIQPSKGKTIR